MLLSRIAYIHFIDPKMGISFGKPHAGSKAEIDALVEGFAHAAEYLEKAGFDGI